MRQATIHPLAQIAADVVIGAHAVVGEGVKIGSGTIVGNGCVLHEDTVIGSGVRIFDNAVLGRVPQRVASMTRKMAQGLEPLVIGDGCVIGACAVLYRGTSIGEATLLGDLATIREECSVGANTVIARLVSINYHTRIGRHVKIMDNTHITGNMLIEDGVFISVLVSTTNDRDMDRRKHAPNDFRGPSILRGASIGASTTILPGIIIGEYAMVGAGSQVYRNVPPRKVVMGVPARVVRDVPADLLPTTAEAMGEMP